MADRADADGSASPSAPVSLDEAVEWLRKHFRPEAAEDLNVRYLVELSGEGGGPIRLAIADGRVEVERAAEPEPDVRMRLPAADYLAILAGRANADLLYMEGRLEIDGDLALATRLRTLFRPRA
jgi:predicted lipid carrier protein YhbT